MEKNKYYKISDFIINNKNYFMIGFVLITIMSIFTMSFTKVEDDLLFYLDDDSLTKTGLSVMDDEFSDPNISARLMVESISLEESYIIYEKINNVNGVLMVSYDESSNFIDDNALYNITIDSTNNEDGLITIESIKEELSSYIIYVDSSVYLADIEGLNNDMVVILLIVVVLILLIVTFTSKSFAEIIILLLVFATAALINMGTNFIFGKISFISNAVAVILQLALAIDYALILMHRYIEERESNEVDDAIRIALSKAIPEISSSSLTTIFSLIALSFMTYNIGADLSKVLIKSIIISLLAVFTLMPALIVVFKSLIDKTMHKNFVPNIQRLGNFAIKSRYVLIPMFIIITISAGILSYKTDYQFYESGASIEYKLEVSKIDEVFSSSNNMIILVENNDLEKQSEYISVLKSMENITSVSSFNSFELVENVTFSTGLSYATSAILLDIDPSFTYMIYTSYATIFDELELFQSSVDEYVISVYDLIYFLYDNINNEQINLSDDIKEMLIYQVGQISYLENIFESSNYSRIIIDTNLDIEEDSTFMFIDELIDVTDSYFTNSYLIGNSINSYELSNAFNIDNKLINILSIIFIAIILIATFKSVFTAFGMILVIQSSIYINFAFPYIYGVGLYFIGYLIVAAIQMGANIDYAIVITNRYKILLESMSNKDAISKALNEAFPTIITSGSILAIAGIVLYNVSSNVIISTLGLCIGRGTLISMILVLLVLPQLLYIETKLIKNQK